MTPIHGKLMDPRYIELQNWLGKNIKGDFKMKPLAGDASFRRYFRVHLSDPRHPQTLIAMDAPPSKEMVTPFVAIAKILQNAKIQAPAIVEANENEGFLLLSDFGDQLLLNQLNPDTADKLYRLAFADLSRIQHCQPTAWNIPTFNEQVMLDELNLFTEWYLKTHLALQLTPHDQQIIENTFNLLIASALEQPQIFVHRDFHSRNILCLSNENLGILDFQDAVMGPLTYDLVSLLRDCYIDWPPAQVTAWATLFYNDFCHRHYLKNISLAQYLRWFDWVGLQRHIKVLGIFSRLNYRDHKANYLNDLPRVLNYVLTVAKNYSELTEFYNWLQEKI